MKTKMRIVKTGFGIMFLTAVVLFLTASAVPEYLPKLQNVYGNGSCETCHFNSNGGGDLTGYGNKFAGETSHFRDPEQALRIIGEPPFRAPVKMSEYVLVQNSMCYAIYKLSELSSTCYDYIAIYSEDL